MQAAATKGLAQRHPMTAEWEGARSVVLRGADLNAQMSALADHPLSSGSTLALIYGDEQPPLFQTAVARLSRAKAWPDRVKEATRFLSINDAWPGLHLIDDSA